jgi:hypothetical protein
MTPSEIEPAAFRLVVQYRKQLRHYVPQYEGVYGCFHAFLQEVKQVGGTYPLHVQYVQYDEHKMFVTCRRQEELN